MIINWSMMSENAGNKKYINLSFISFELSFFRAVI